MDYGRRGSNPPQERAPRLGLGFAFRVNRNYMISQHVGLIVGGQDGTTAHGIGYPSAQDRRRAMSRSPGQSVPHKPFPARVTPDPSRPDPNRSTQFQHDLRM